MCAGQGHVLDDQASLTDQMVLLELGRPEVNLDGAQRSFSDHRGLGDRRRG